MTSRGTSGAGPGAEQLDAPADVEVAEHHGGGAGQTPPPRRRQHPAGHVVGRDLADQVVDVDDGGVGVAGGQPLEGGVQHVGRGVADGVADRLGDQAAVLVLLAGALETGPTSPVLFFGTPDFGCQTSDIGLRAFGLTHLVELRSIGQPSAAVPT